jgi:hypothetical protein
LPRPSNAGRRSDAEHQPLGNAAAPTLRVQTEIAEWQTYINGRFAESKRIIRARKRFMKKAAYNGFPRQQVITLMPTNPRCKTLQ